MECTSDQPKPAYRLRTAGVKAGRKRRIVSDVIQSTNGMCCIDSSDRLLLLSSERRWQLPWPLRTIRKNMWFRNCVFRYFGQDFEELRFFNLTISLRAIFCSSYNYSETRNLAPLSNLRRSHMGVCQNHLSITVLGCPGVLVSVSQLISDL